MQSKVIVRKVLVLCNKTNDVTDSDATERVNSGYVDCLRRHTDEPLVLKRSETRRKRKNANTEVVN